MHRGCIGRMAMGEELLPGCVSWPFIPGWSQPSQDHLGAGGTYTLSLIKNPADPSLWTLLRLATALITPFLSF